MLCERKRGATKLISWRCKCGQYKSIRDGSFFSLYRTPLTHLALIIKMWAAQLTITKAVSLFELLTNNNNITMSELNVEPKQRKIRIPKEKLPFSPRVTRSQKKKKNYINYFYYLKL